MNGFMLACIRAGVALAIIAALAPHPALAADDAWPGIRADYREGNFVGALASLNALLAANPGDREALYYAAIIHWRLEDYARAAAAYRRVLALDAQGPFGQDARMWLDTYGRLAAPAKAPVAPPKAAQGRVASAVPSAAAKAVRPRPPARAPKPAARVPAPVPSSSAVRVVPRRSVLPFEALRPTAKPKSPWLQAQPGGKNRRARSANPRPGYFKVADGSFEFVPPAGFVLLDEGAQGNELSTLFGLPKGARTSETSPTLLITWREFDDLKDLKPDQRIAKERQLLTMEASMYGPGAQLEARFGGPCYRVRQSQGAWGADTLLFFQHGKLYALTFGGAADQLAHYQASVLKSWETPIFYP
jgi:hypothetical protein